MAYTRLLRAYYRTEKPIPCDQVHRLARAPGRAARAAVDSVLKEFFSKQDDGWHNKRADEEIAAYQAQADTNRRIAQARSRQRTVNEPLHESSYEPKTKRIPNHKPEPRTINQSNPLPPCANALDWLPPEWVEYEQHRKEKRQPLTPTARKQCLAKLDAWRLEGRDLGEILRHNIANGYTGLFLPDQKGNGRSVTLGNIAAAQEWVRREEEKDGNRTP